MVRDEGQVLAGLLMGLNAIDYNMTLSAEEFDKSVSLGRVWRVWGVWGVWRAIVFECELHWAELYIVDRCSGRIKFVPMKSSLVVRSSKLRHLSVMTLSYAIFFL